MSASRRRPPNRERPILGTYSGHPRGFGFLTQAGGGPDLFVPPGREGQAVDGDTVEAAPLSGGAARVLRVTDRGRKRLSGTYVGRQAFSPDAHRIPRILPVEGEASKGDKVLVSARPEGFVVERVLGRAGAPDVEDEAVLAELEIAPEFSPEVTGAAAQLQPFTPEHARQRLDLRRTTTVVTIDPVTARDYDDAISLEREGADWVLGVHIADVGHYVSEGSPLDLEARRRGVSVYLPARVVPMLPERLSNDLCSLRQGVDRLTMSVLMRYSRDGELLETTFAEAVIRSDRRFSYERASRIMEERHGTRGGVHQLLPDMAALAALLKRRRNSFDIPRHEPELVFSPRGDVVDIRPTAQDVAHEVIAEFMLAANREVARLMLSEGKSALFRHHPRPTDMTGVHDALRTLGVAQGTRIVLGPAIRRAVEAGFGPAVSTALLRCMPRAEYTCLESSHSALGFEAYCHFTSPIRRYTDLVMHRRLRAELRRQGGVVRMPPDRKLLPPVEDAALESLAVQLNARTVGAERAESRLRRRRVLEFLLRQGPLPTEGQVVTVVERGLLVELPDYGISGFLAADMLPKGPYTLDNACLRGDDRSFALGDTLEVCVDRIDPAASQLDLALAPRY